jgi:hypothetical protein
MFSGLRKIALALLVALFLIPSLASAATFERPLSLGMSGTDVSALQTILKEKGFYMYPEITGYYGQVTLQAVADFQKSVGLESLGYVGPQTRAILNREVIVPSTGTTSVSNPSLLSSLISQLQQLLRNAGYYLVPLSGVLDQATIQAAQSISSGVTNAATPRRSGGKSSNSDDDEEVATPDTSAPVLSAIVSSPSLASATITWTSDELASSRVDYGATSAYGTASTSAVLTTSHSVTVTGLTASTLYHFRIQSTDAASNTATSSDQTFTTSAVPDTTAPVISAIASSTATSTATITWTTNEASDSRVDYGASSAYGTASTSAALSTSHSVILTGLTASTTYHFRVQSTDASSNVATSSDLTFTVTDTTIPLGYVTTFNDQFATLDLNRWEPRFYDSVDPKGSLPATEYAYFVDPAHAGWNGFTPFSASSTNGLTISAVKASTLGLPGGQVPTDSKTGNPFEWLTGYLQTKDSFTFRSGVVDFWLGPVTQTGAAWPAGWLRPVEGLGVFPEVDVIELIGNEPNDAKFNGHLGASESYPGHYDQGSSLFAGMHNYRAIITDTSIRYYVDGVLRHTINTTALPAFQAEYYPIIDLALGSNLPSWVPPPNGSTPDPVTGVFKRVRIAQKAGPDSISLSETAVLTSHTPGVIGTLSHTAFGASTGGTYSIVSGGGSFSIAGNQFSASGALAAGSYNVTIRVTDAQGETWQKLFTIVVIADTLPGTNLLASPTSLSNAAWTKYDATIVTGQTDLEGGTTAERIQETATNAVHAITQVYTKGAATTTYNLAMDLKPDGREWVKIDLANDYADTAVHFVNLSTGAAGDSFSTVPGAININSYSTIDLGNGYRRVLMNVTVGPSVTSFRLQLKLTLNNSEYSGRLGDVTKGVISRTKMQLVVAP